MFIFECPPHILNFSFLGPQVSEAWVLDGLRIRSNVSMEIFDLVTQQWSAPTQRWGSVCPLLSFAVQSAVLADKDGLPGLFVWGGHSYASEAMTVQKPEELRSASDDHMYRWALQ